MATRRTQWGMSENIKRQPLGIPTGGQFAAAAHEESPVALRDKGAISEHLESVGDQAALKVNDIMPEANAENDGGGIYLTLEAGDTGFTAGCPTIATGDEHAKWYVSTSDGSFHEEHPSFDHTADPAMVASWIREQHKSLQANQR